MIKKALGLFTLAGLLGSLCGCNPFSMAKSAVSEIRGGYGELHPIQPLAPGAMADIATINFLPAYSSVGNELAPPGLLAAYNAATDKQLKKRLPAKSGGDAPALEISAEFLYFHNKSLMSGATCICRIRGQSEGRMLFEGMVHAESKSFTQGGETALAEATADAVLDYLEGK